MWKFNKTTLFILMLSMSVCTGISTYMINWNIVKSGDGAFRELHLPIIFLGLTFFFMVPYVKSLKEQK